MENNTTLELMRRDALDIFKAGIKAVEAQAAVCNALVLEGDLLTVGGRRYDLKEFKRVLVLGAGKASAFMAAGAEQILGARIDQGLVCVKYGHGTKLEKIRLMEAGHPIPDASGEAAARAILELATQAGPDDLVVFLLSGGGSALLPLAWEGIRLEDKQQAASLMLASGATIHQINTVRKHCSRIKGGRLAQAAAPAKLITLIISDVVGNDLDVIASGPTVADTSTFADALEIIGQLGLKAEMPAAIISHLEAGLRRQVPETPKAESFDWRHVHNVIIADNLLAMEAARKKAQSLGYNTLLLSSRIEGETRIVAQVHGAMVREVSATANPIDPPACLLSGGETTVTIRGEGLGGRNMEFALAAAMDIAGCRDIVVLSGGTDGTDGPTDAAGAISDGLTTARANRIGFDAAEFLKRNDSYHFFETLNDLVITGPTHTNVMDLRIMLIGSQTI